MASNDFTQCFPSSKHQKDGAGPLMLYYEAFITKEYSSTTVMCLDMRVRVVLSREDSFFLFVIFIFFKYEFM